MHEWWLLACLAGSPNFRTKINGVLLGEGVVIHQGYEHFMQDIVGCGLMNRRIYAPDEYSEEVGQVANVCVQHRVSPISLSFFRHGSACTWDNRFLAIAAAMFRTHPLGAGLVTASLRLLRKLRKASSPFQCHWTSP